MRPRSDTLLVWTGAPCVYGCPACPIDPHGAADAIPLADLQQGLAAVKGKQGRLVVLVGGEPFLRPDLPRLLATIRAAGCLPGIVTTGRPLVYPKLRDTLRRAGLAYLRLQLFGLDQVHDQAVAVPGAFEQAMAGLRAWLAEGSTQCDVDVALSTRGRPIESVLSEIEVLAAQLPGALVQMVVALDPAAGSEPADVELLRAAVTRFAAWNDDPSRPLLAWEGFPEPALAATSMTLAPLPPLFVGTEPTAFCIGAVTRIARSMAVRSLRTCANSFNYVRTSTVVPSTADAAACTAYAAAPELEPHRQAWLIEGDQLVLHSSDTADFTAAEIGIVKDEMSHLFVDRQQPGSLDDFKEGMRRVLPDPTCGSCAHRSGCGHRYHMVEGQPFAREEAWIAGYIADLRGRVLDVGCGEQLYKDEIGPLLRSGVVQYTGIDPDEVGLSRLRFYLPEGRFFLGGIEGFRDAPASYDHILCLRSLNHVINVDEALARMAGLLKPGGLLLLVECTPFALLRRPQQVAAADRAPRAGHQHLRNFASQEVIPFARRRGLQVLHHQPATLQTTNEWILLLGRAEARPTQTRHDLGGRPADPQ